MPNFKRVKNFKVAAYLQIFASILSVSVFSSCTASSSEKISSENSENSDLVYEFSEREILSENISSSSEYFTLDEYISLELEVWAAQTQNDATTAKISSSVATQNSSTENISTIPIHQTSPSSLSEDEVNLSNETTVTQIAHAKPPVKDLNEIDFYSTSVFFADPLTDKIIFSKNPYQKEWPASTTKIMTAIIALENISDLYEKVDITDEVFREFYAENPDEAVNPNNTGIATSGIRVGQKANFYDLLYALMLPSGCEAGNALALNVTGETDFYAANKKFTELMNKKVAEIGCVNTNFTNAHGLFNENNYTCAYDLYLISKYAAYESPKKEIFNTIVSTVEYTFTSGYTRRNSNRLVRPTETEYYRDYVKGIKTGALDHIYIKDEDGEWAIYEGISSLVSNAEKDGEEFICVTLGATYHNKYYNYGCFPYKDHNVMYDFIFGQ